jgi:hypothetical protein
MANHGAQIQEHMKRHQEHLQRLATTAQNAAAEAVKAHRAQQQRENPGVPPVQEAST